MEFLVININVPYNVIMGRHWLREIKVVVSPFHYKLKSPSLEGIIEVREIMSKLACAFIWQSNVPISSPKRIKENRPLHWTRICSFSKRANPTNNNQSSGATLMYIPENCPKTRSKGS